VLPAPLVPLAPVVSVPVVVGVVEVVAPVPVVSDGVLLLLRWQPPSMATSAAAVNTTFVALLMVFIANSPLRSFVPLRRAKAHG
jgi:hypothetical protein